MTPTLKLLYDRCAEVGKCRIWQQGTSNGRPAISLSAAQRSQAVRPIAWALVHGRPVPEGQFVYVTCHQDLCIGEECMRVGTKSQYMRNASKAGAYSTPAVKASRAKSRHANSRLNWNVVRAIRAARQEGQLLRDIAQAHGICVSHVSKIATGKYWRETAVGATVFGTGAQR